MPVYTFVRASAAANTAINTAQALTNDSLGVASSAITLPGQVTAIVSISGSVNWSTVAQTSALGTNFCLRLTGNGLWLTQDIAVAGFTLLGLGATGATLQPIYFDLPLNQWGCAIPLNNQPGNQISVQLFAAAGGVSTINWNGAVNLTMA